MTKAADGDKKAQIQLYIAAPILKSRGKGSYNFSPVDGTPIDRKAIAKKYGLSAQELEAAGAKPITEPQDTDSSQEDDMIRMIKSRGGDPEKLKKRMAFFQGENNE